MTNNIFCKKITTDCTFLLCSRGIVAANNNKSKAPLTDMSHSPMTKMTLILFFLTTLLLYPTASEAAETKRVQTLNITPDSSLALTVRHARELRRLGKADSVVIHLSQGTYRLYEPLVLRPEDSHLSIVGEGKGTVVSGGVKIGGWRKQGRYYVATVPDFNGQPMLIRQLWVNGLKARRARDVKDLEDMARVRANDKKNQLLWVPARSVKPLLDSHGRLREDCRYAEMVLHQMWEVSFLRIRNIRIQGDSAAISFHNPEARIQAERPWPQPMVDGKHNSPFYLTGALPLLDEPGEWYYDQRRSLLYYIPRTGEDMSRADVEAGALETIISIVGTPQERVKNITLKGLTLSHTTWLRPAYCGHVPLQAGMFLTEGYKLRPKINRLNNHGLDNQGWLGRPRAAIEAESCSGIILDQCRVEHLGGGGVDFANNCHGGGVQNSLFTDIALNGIICGSFSPQGLETHKPYLPATREEVCDGMEVLNTEISDAANEDWGCCAIAAGYVSRMNIDHCYLHDVSYSAISLGWGWHRDPGVMFSNRVHACLIERYAGHMYDCAGIYTLGSQPGTVIYENVVRDILKPSYVHDPNHWFYLYTDEGSANILLKDNWTPTEKYLQNANGPCCQWTGNGPAVKDSLVQQAGLLPEGKRMECGARVEYPKK